MEQLVVIKYLKGELMNWVNMLRKDEEDISEYTDWLPMGVEPFKTMDHSKFVEDIKFIEDNILPKVTGIINTLGIKQSIRNHKWIEGEKGRHLTWLEAKNDWLKLQPSFKQGWISLMFVLDPYMLNDE